MFSDRILRSASYVPISLRAPNAWVGHVPFAAWVIQEVSPKIFVELGTHSGNSYFSFCQSVVEAGLSAKCFAVDTWQGDEHAGLYNEDVFSKVDAHHQEHYAGFSRLLRMTFDEAVSYFTDQSVELLHIDGLHTYEAVRHDFDTWLPKLAPGAVVLFHDTNVRERIFGVWKVWEELQARYSNNLEFVHSHGLGVLQLNNAPHDKKIDWLEANSPEKQRIINYFTALGSRQLENFDLKQRASSLDGQVEAFRLQAEQFDLQLRAATGQIEAYRLQAEQFDLKLRDATGQVEAYTLQAKQFDLKLRDAAQQIADLKQTMSEHRGQIAAYKRQAEQFDLQLRNAHGRIAGLNKIVGDCDQEIYGLRSSKSWRITKPLRFITQLLKGKRNELPPFSGSRALEQLARQFKNDDQMIFQDLSELPVSYDEAVYLKLYPDVAASGVDPVYHYLLHGRHEGRLCSLPQICIDHDFDVDRETILVVSHEASRTGAPVLSLNLVQALVERYNVVALLLDGGPLSDAFRLAGAAVMTSSILKGNLGKAFLVVGHLCECFNFKFALVNSIESRDVLPVLSSRFVPAISLLHEFASYTRPRDAFRNTFFWSGEVVFSAKVTLENAFAEYPDLDGRSAHVLPQGRCLVPLGEFTEKQLQAERKRIRHLIRPQEIAENSVVVIGIGTVQLRKGVDLFIECAARVVRAQGGNNCRFVWIGKGYDPDTDVGYSVYLADQIRRSGLQEHVFFVDETPALETAYEEADLLLLSSRLDPLPNVAIDAMAHGVPVICFNKTTGIADFLIDSGIGNHCVAEYLDSADMAGKVLALAGSQVLRKNIADRCREASIASFNMKDYVARLEFLAQDVCERTRQEKEDTKEILGSGLFRQDFSCPPQGRSQTIEAHVRAFVRSWATGLGRRKPFPGFHPGIYLEQHGLAAQGANPFADYLRAGRPEGPWNYPVIVAGEIAEKDLPDHQRVALHVHAYYPELLPEITSRLSRNRICPDMFVSVTNEKARESVVDQLKDYKGSVVDIQLVPNCGRDIGPFLTAFGQRILADYDFIGHLHTKKTTDVKDAAVGQLWYRFLLENLLGGESGAMADSILARMKDDPSMGMVFPDEPNIVGWNSNRIIAESLAGRVGLHKLPDHFVFPVGTMFWARASALAPLMNLKLDWDDYPEEPLPYDGTLLHAIERLLPLCLSTGNLHIAATNVAGLTR